MSETKQDKLIDFNGRNRITATRVLRARVKESNIIFDRTTGYPISHNVYERDATEMLYFQWHGGQYIEVGFSLSQPMEVINVWDSDKDEPLIPRTRRAFVAAIDEWIANYNEDDPGQSVTSLLQDAQNWCL